MDKNLLKPFALALLVVAALLALFFLPRLTVGDTTLRRVNILSDIERRDAEGNVLAEAEADSAQGIVAERLDTAAVKVEAPAIRDSVPPGMVAIEDFGPDSAGRAMDAFYAALDEAAGRVVRIGYFGDSYIEGDLLTQDLRDMLQRRYGGRGVGYVDISTPTEGFRQTVVQKSAGWTSHLYTDAHGFSRQQQGFAGKYFNPGRGASLLLTGTRHHYPGRIDTASVATIYYSPSSGLDFCAAINGEGFRKLHTPTDTLDTPSHAILAQRLEGRIGRLRLRVDSGSHARFYGVALEGGRGIVLDNLSLRGTNGRQIATVPEATMARFAELRPYDLIVVQYGLNVASPKTKDYSGYTRQMARSIQLLRRAYPNTSILVVGVGDRDERNEQGELRTMGGVRELALYQRKMAADERVAFWNLYEAMGGEGSIARMQQRRQANLDYTHINAAGGRVLARLLYDALMNGKENHDRRNR